MTTQNDLNDPAKASRTNARNGVIWLAVALGIGAIMTFVVVLTEVRHPELRTASHRPLKAETTQAQRTAPVAASATTATAATPAATTKVHVAAKVAGVDLSNCTRVAGLSSKNGKITARFEDCAQILWTTNGTNNAVATAEGGSK